MHCAFCSLLSFRSDDLPDMKLPFLLALGKPACDRERFAESAWQEADTWSFLSNRIACRLQERKDSTAKKKIMKRIVSLLALVGCLVMIGCSGETPTTPKPAPGGSNAPATPPAPVK